jgi:hypothetical protein
MSGVGLFKEGFRNQFNNHRRDGYFSGHYHQMFGLRLAHQDTLNDVLRELEPTYLEEVRMNLMSELFEQKCLRDTDY